jgi:hypothetical protein
LDTGNERKGAGKYNVEEVRIEAEMIAAEEMEEQDEVEEIQEMDGVEELLRRVKRRMLDKNGKKERRRQGRQEKGESSFKG